MRTVFLLFAFVSFFAPYISSAQNDPLAEEILNKVSSKYRSYKAFKVDFNRWVESAGGDEIKGHRIAGEILVSGKKFNLKTPDQEIFCDGNTLWTYMKRDQEVNVSDYEPSAEEITPGEIFTLYQKGYRYIMIGEVKINGAIFENVDLEPEDKTKEIFKVRLVINKQTKAIKRWVVFEKGTNNRQIFEVKQFFANPPMETNAFAFDKSKFPSVKVVDLR